MSPSQNPRSALLCTDVGGEFDGPFQSRLRQLTIYHERTRPRSPPQNSDVIKRSLGLPRGKTASLLRDITMEGRAERLCAEAIDDAYGKLNQCVTTSIDQDIAQ